MASSTSSDGNPSNVLQQTPVVLALAAIACLLWGSAPACIKTGYELFQIPAESVSSQILFAGIRFVLAGVIALVLGSIMERRPLLPTREILPDAFKLSLFQTVGQYICYYVGLAHTTGVKAAIIVSLSTFFSPAIACFLFHQERLTGRKTIGCLLGIAGVVVANLTGSGFDASMSWLGEGLVMGSSVCYAFSSVLVSRYSQHEDPTLLSGMQFLIGGAIMAALGLALGGSIPRITPTGLVLLIYLGFISGVAYTLWALLLQNNPVSRISVFGTMNPVFGVILSAIFLNEVGVLPIWQCSLALCMVALGIVVVNRS